MDAPIHAPDPRENLICRCYHVTEARIREAVAAGSLKTVEQVTAATKAAGGCSSCYDDVRDILDEMTGHPRAARRAGRLTAAQKRTVVQKLYRESLEPLYRLNGVEGRILGIEDDRVYAWLKGPTVNTTLPSILTLKWALVRMMSDACGEKMQLIEMNRLGAPEPAGPA